MDHVHPITAPAKNTFCGERAANGQDRSKRAERMITELQAKKPNVQFKRKSRKSKKRVVSSSSSSSSARSKKKSKSVRMPRSFNSEQRDGTRGSSKKGSTHVTSMLHHHLETNLASLRYLFLWADNCSGQNKNRTVIWYLLWRILTGRNERISYGFMVAGHTKNEADGLFGRIKQRLYAQDELITTKQLKDVVQGAVRKHRVTTSQDVLWFDWQGFLGQFFKAPLATKSQQVFVFSRTHPTSVASAPNWSSSVSQAYVLLKDGISPEAVVAPQRHGLKPLSHFVLGHLSLNVERHKQLSYDIAEMCTERNQEAGCELIANLGVHPLCPLHRPLRETGFIRVYDDCHCQFNLRGSLCQLL